MLVIVGAVIYVYWSAADVADVPPGVVTVTSTVPELPAGAVAVIDVAEFTVTPVAAVVPNVTAVAPDRFVPVSVTLVPPDVGPDVGDTLVIVGTAMYVYWSAADVADVPPVVVTLTSTVPELPAGAVAVIDVAEFTVTPVAIVAPNVTAVAPDRFVPVNVTLVPPDVGPDVGDTLVIVGTAMYVNWSAADVADVPPGVVTVTSTVPELPAGAVTVIDVAEFTVMPVAAVAPNVTAVAPDRFVPVNVTLVPPAVGPDCGDMLSIVGTIALTSTPAVLDTPFNVNKASLPSRSLIDPKFSDKAPMVIPLLSDSPDWTLYLNINALDPEPLTKVAYTVVAPTTIAIPGLPPEVSTNTGLSMFTKKSMGSPTPYVPSAGTDTLVTEGPAVSANALSVKYKGNKHKTIKPINNFLIVLT
nr:hypothetical protein [Paenibacillus rhizovicinus]